ncbi:MAG: hypothetical protein ACOC1F_14205 [Myxococcota bacterium]
MRRKATHALVIALLACTQTAVAGDSRCRRLGALATAPDCAADLDRDGIPDAKEERLARRFAPVVVLDSREWALPASVRWLLDRLQVGARHDAVAPPRVRLEQFPSWLHRGSTNQRDWTTYVHVYRSRDRRRIYIQYWFFYPYNNGTWFVHHEGDWEHVTVALTRRGSPLGVYAATHGNNAPGRYRPWKDVRVVQGTHPEILAARGSHGCYFDESDVGWRDTARPCHQREAGCARLRWRTWEAGGLAQMGELHAPRQPFVMTYRHYWGTARRLPGMSAPRGPAFQSGWCVDGFADCGPQH